MRVLFCLFLSLLFNVFAVAQQGGYFLTHYSPSNQEINNVNFDIAQTSRGVICIANRSGIIQFDGKTWEVINTPSAIFSIAIDSSNTLYTGGINGFGKLGRGIDNRLKYISLSDSSVQDVFDIVLYDNFIYGINSNKLYIHNLEEGTTETIRSNYSGEFLSLALIDNQIYANTTIGGLKRVASTGLKEPPSLELFEDLQIEFISAANNKGQHLIGTTDGHISIFENSQLNPVNLEQDYLETSVIVNGTWIADSLVAVTTLKGGVVFVNLATQEIEQIVNYQNGLPDNEIFAAALDSHQGLWVAHNEGFTRISPKFPFRSYDRYPGLEGDMVTVQFHNDTLYVGTTLGVFYLDKVKNYNEKIIKVKETIEQNPQPKVTAHKKNGFFGFLKRNKEDSKNTKQKTRTHYVTTVQKELQSIQYEFKRIEGIKSKALHLTSLGDRLFCGGLDGLYELSGGGAKAISNVPIRSFHASENYQKLFANTYNDSFLVFDISSPAYSPVNIFSDFHDYVSYIFEDQQGRVWFCSSNDLYWIKLRGNEIADTHEYFIKNPYFYDTYGVAYNDSVHFVNESGIYALDEQDNKIITLENRAINNYLKDNNGKVWLMNNEKWTTLGSNVESTRLDQLSVFTDIKYISYDQQKKDFWVLTSNDDLYKLIETGFSKDMKSYNLFLKTIRSTSKTFLPSSKLAFNQQNNSLVFEFVQPEYSGVIDIKYQYQLVGLNDQWSEWSSSYNIIDIPYLPDGNYELKIRSKNVISGIQEIEPISFKIIPPYWKRAWFLAFEVIAMALLLFLSVRLKRLGYRYRMMSRLLALLTLIIIIEFIQTVAENRLGTETSPVIDFIIQIIVAIIILPVEGMIRKYIFKEKDVQIMEFFTVKNKN